MKKTGCSKPSATASSASAVSPIGSVVVVDSDATVVVVEAEPAGSVVVVVSGLAGVEDGLGVEDGTVLGAGSEVQAAATSSTTIGMTNRSLMSVRLDNPGGLGRSVGFAGHATALGFIDPCQQVDAEDEEDDQSQDGGP